MTQPPIPAVGGGGNNESLMPPGRSGYVADGCVVQGDGLPRGPPDVSDYWHALINEREGGRFLGLTDRTLQSYRQRGSGPKYISISSRCLRYRRIDLKAWADARIRTSTSDPGQSA